jgi:2'-5' RNA ligase
MRLFVAINLPPAVRDALYADAARLRVASSAVRWVAAPSLHVTLKFLGERGEELVPDLERAIGGVAARHRPFDIQTTGFGAFPNFRRARVVWVGMTGEPELRALVQDLDRALEPLGILAESRLFRAHLTLGRLKSEITPAAARALAAAAEVTPETRGFSVRTVDLMHSELGPGGSRYTLLAAAPLHARGT